MGGLSVEKDNYKEKKEILNNLYDEIDVYTVPDEWYESVILDVFLNYSVEDFKKVTEIILESRATINEEYNRCKPSFSEWSSAKKLHNAMN